MRKRRIEIIPETKPVLVIRSARTGACPWCAECAGEVPMISPVVVPVAGWEYVNDRTIRLLPPRTPFKYGRLYESFS